MKFLIYIFNIIFLTILGVIALIYLFLMLISYMLKSDNVAKYCLHIAEGIDQAMNGILGGNVDHTISGRMGYRIKTGQATFFEIWLCKLLSKIDQTSDTHCISAIEWDEI